MRHFEITLDEMWAITEQPEPYGLGWSCRALLEALDEVEYALDVLNTHPGSPALQRLNCAWMLALRRYEHYRRLRADTGRPA